MKTTRRVFLGGGLVAAAAAAASCASVGPAQTAPLAGGEIAYSRGGAGAPALVLIHGLQDDRSTWSRVFDPLAEMSTVIAYDRPGAGASAWSPRPRDTIAMSDELDAFIASLALEGPVVLIGHSLGGAIAQTYARRFPHKTAGLILVDTSLPGQHDWLKANAPTVLSLAGALMLQPAARREFQDSPAGEAQIEQFAPYRNGPVLFLAAQEKDPLAPGDYADWRHAQMRRLAAEQDGQMRLIASGHYIQRDKPDAVIAAAREVLAVARARG